MTKSRVEYMTPQQQRTLNAKSELLKLAALLDHKGTKYAKDWLPEAGTARMLGQVVIKALRAEACSSPGDACDELDDIASYAMLVKSMLMETKLRGD